MKTVRNVFVALSLFSISISASAIKVSVNISNLTKKGTPVELILQDGSAHPIVIDDNGKGSIDINTDEAGYLQLKYGYLSRTLWLNPKQAINIAFEENKFHQSVSLDGDEIAVNRYLNDSNLSTITINECGVKEDAFLKMTKKMLEDNCKKLEDAKLPEAFHKSEENRLIYYTLQNIASYPEYYQRMTRDTTYTPTAGFYNLIRGLAEFKSSLMEIDEYRTFISKTVSVIARQDNKGMNRYDAELKFIEKNVNDDEVAQFLYNKTIYSYVERHGIDNGARYIEMFRKNVHKPQMVENFDKLYNKWKKIAKGEPSPQFKAKDINGKVVTLSDLKGKYIFIDIWATWCVPCRKEIPHLARLEQMFEGKDIHFVSISCDKSIKAWKDKVTKDDMKGIQLIFDGDDTFMQDYMINGIPRFIILDKEGKIVSRESTRPSNPETERKLLELLNQ